MKIVSTLSKKTNHCISPKYQTAALEELSLSVAPMQPFHSSTLIWLPALHKMDLLHCRYFDVSWQERCINGSYIPLSGGPASVCAASLSLLLGYLMELWCLYSLWSLLLWIQHMFSLLWHVEMSAVQQVCCLQTPDKCFLYKQIFFFLFALLSPDLLSHVTFFFVSVFLKISPSVKYSTCFFFLLSHSSSFPPLLLISIFFS